MAYDLQFALRRYKMTTPDNFANCPQNYSHGLSDSTGGWIKSHNAAKQFLASNAAPPPAQRKPDRLANDDSWEGGHH